MFHNRQNMQFLIYRLQPSRQLHAASAIWSTQTRSDSAFYRITLVHKFNGEIIWCCFLLGTTGSQCTSAVVRPVGLWNYWRSSATSCLKCWRRPMDSARWIRGGSRGRRKVWRGLCMVPSRSSMWRLYLSTHSRRFQPSSRRHHDKRLLIGSSCQLFARVIPKVSGLDILDNNIFHNLYIGETYILYELYWVGCGYDVVVIYDVTALNRSDFQRQ